MANNDAGRTTAVQRRARGRADKRTQVMAAARSVFGRYGFVDTSIGAIAQAAGVSTRTIYNHFDSKEELFAAVLLESTQQVSQATVERIEQLAESDDPAVEVHELALVLSRQRPDFPEHFALVAQINAEAQRTTFPPEVIDTWQEKGPRRVRKATRRRLESMVARGSMEIEDCERAARQLAALVGSIRLEQDSADVAPELRSAAQLFTSGYGVGRAAG